MSNRNERSLMRGLDEIHASVEVTADVSLTDVVANASESELLAVLEHASRERVIRSGCRYRCQQAFEIASNPRIIIGRQR
jgi:hypothetical protein